MASDIEKQAKEEFEKWWWSYMGSDSDLKAAYLAGYKQAWENRRIG